MSVLLRFVLLLFAAKPALAAADLVRLTPNQVAHGGIVSAALSEAKEQALVHLPAQVAVPPAQIEVIAAPLPAMVSAVRVAYGETVKKGTVLLRLQGGALLELQRDHVTAGAQAQLLAENRRRDEALFAEGIIARSRLSATQTAERQAAALAAEKRRAMQLAGMVGPAMEIAGIAELRAPFDGVVIEANVQPGQRVDTLSPLLKLGRLSPLWLEIQAAPGQATGISPGDPVSISGCSRGGRVTLVAPQMQAASQSLLIRAELREPDGCIRPFQYVQAEIRPSKRLGENTWRLPATALVRHQGQVWIFAEVAGGFRPVPVSLLEELPGTALLSARLPGETRVAVRGVSTLKAAWLGLGGNQ